MTGIEALVGKTITAVYANSEEIIFFHPSHNPQTGIWRHPGTQGAEGFTVYSAEAECCSTSNIKIVDGIDKILNNPIISVSERYETDDQPEGKSYLYEEKTIYDYQIVAEHPQFGEVTACIIMQNMSNGYYGGWLDFKSNEIYKNILTKRALTEIRCSETYSVTERIEFDEDGTPS